MRRIMIVPVLLAVAVLFATAPVLAAGDFELRVLEGPFAIAPTATALPTVPAAGNPSSNPVRVLDDRGIR